jgi:hypothetical protein
MRVSNDIIAIYYEIFIYLFLSIANYGFLG